MIVDEFTIDQEEVDNRLKTTIQHKLRKTLKCYTVFEFSLNEETKSYQFKKSYRINGYKINSDFLLEGTYEISYLNDGQAKLKLKIGSNQ